MVTLDGLLNSSPMKVEMIRSNTVYSKKKKKEVLIQILRTSNGDRYLFVDQRCAVYANEKYPLKIENMNNEYKYLTEPGSRGERQHRYSQEKDREHVSRDFIRR